VSRRPLSKLIVAICLPLIAVVASFGPVAASTHGLVTSTPAAGEVTEGPIERVSLTFADPPVPGFAEFHVEDADGTVLATRTILDGATVTLRMDEPIAEGRHRAVWTVGVGSAQRRGVLPFEVVRVGRRVGAGLIADGAWTIEAADALLADGPIDRNAATAPNPLAGVGDQVVRFLSPGRLGPLADSLHAVVAAALAGALWFLGTQVRGRAIDVTRVARSIRVLAALALAGHLAAAIALTGVGSSSAGPTAGRLAACLAGLVGSAAVLTLRPRRSITSLIDLRDRHVERRPVPVAAGVGPVSAHQRAEKGGDISPVVAREWWFDLRTARLPVLGAVVSLTAGVAHALDPAPPTVFRAGATVLCVTAAGHALGATWCMAGLASSRSRSRLSCRMQLRRSAVGTAALTAAVAILGPVLVGVSY
jgi:methionine-rich copper-binding protein CopC